MSSTTGTTGNTITHLFSSCYLLVSVCLFFSLPRNTASRFHRGGCIQLGLWFAFTSQQVFHTSQQEKKNYTRCIIHCCSITRDCIKEQQKTFLRPSTVMRLSKNLSFMHIQPRRGLNWPGIKPKTLLWYDNCHLGLDLRTSCGKGDFTFVAGEREINGTFLSADLKASRFNVDLTGTSEGTFLQTFTFL